jgi:hypothetical protein
MSTLTTIEALPNERGARRLGASLEAALYCPHKTTFHQSSVSGCKRFPMAGVSDETVGEEGLLLVRSVGSPR